MFVLTGPRISPTRGNSILDGVITIHSDKFFLKLRVSALTGDQCLPVLGHKKYPRSVFHSFEQLKQVQVHLYIFFQTTTLLICKSLLHAHMPVSVFEPLRNDSVGLRAETATTTFMSAVL